MPEMGAIAGSWSTTAGAVGASTQGTTVTTSASAHTKGSWTELIASTLFDANWALIAIGSNTSGAGGQLLVDIGIGSSTEQPLFPNLFYHVPPTGTNNGLAYYLFPCFIPRGSRLSARSQSSFAASITSEVVVYLFHNHLLGGNPGGGCRDYGGIATSRGVNVDPGTTPNADSGWVEVTAATEFDHNWICVAGQFGDRSLSAATRWLLDIGVGAATEQEFISDLIFSADTTRDMPLVGNVCFPCFIPKGTRLTARARCNVATNADRDVYIKIYGA